MKFTYSVTTEKDFETDSLQEIVEKFAEEGVGTLSFEIQELSFSFTIENSWDEINIQYDDGDSMSEWTSYIDYERSVKDYIESEYEKEEIDSITSIKI